MIELPEIINQNSYMYTRIKKEGRFYIYEQKDPKLGNIVGYEVIRAKISPRRELYGVIYPEYEKYPSKSDFGKCGWYHETLSKAEEEFNSLLEKENAKQKGQQK